MILTRSPDTRENDLMMFEDAGLQVDSTSEITKRHDLVVWAERQGCKGDTIEDLVQILRDVPRSAAAWMQMKDAGTPKCSFVNHHILISGKK